MPDTERKLRVFLCHASQDKPVVRELYQRLLSEGWIDPWLDEEKLLPGQDWDLEIEKAAENSDAVLVCLSNNSITKEGYVQRELRFVLDIALEKPEGSIFIIPIRLDPCDPPRRLRSWQFTDYFPAQQKAKALEKLLSSFRLRAESLGVNISVFSTPSDYNVNTQSVGKQAWIQWAALEKENGNIERARDLYNRAVEVNPINSEAWLQWATLEKESGNIERARDLYNRAVEVNPINSEAWLQWAAMEKEFGNIERARELYLRATEAS